LDVIRDAKLEPGHYLREQQLGCSCRRLAHADPLGLNLLAKAASWRRGRTMDTSAKAIDSLHRIEIEVPSTPMRSSIRNWFAPPRQCRSEFHDPERIRAPLRCRQESR